jgi:hypothetical protein
MHGGKGDSLTLDASADRLTWICATHCGAGDVIGMIQSIRGCSFPDALREAADLAGVDLDDDDSDEAQAERERARAAYLAVHAASNPEPPDSPGYVPVAEVEAIWADAAPVTDDREVSAYLESRAMPASTVASHGLLRALRPGQPLPRWARYRGDADRARTWLETGHRILIRTWDHLGQLRGVRAWRVGGDEETPKRLPPAGYSSAGLVWANEIALEMLRTPYPCTVVVSEGEPDMVVNALRRRCPVIGITSGSWTQALADRIAFGSEVVIRTDRDVAGDKYAAAIRKTLGDRATMWRVAA